MVVPNVAAALLLMELINSLLSLSFFSANDAYPCSYSDVMTSCYLDHLHIIDISHHPDMPSWGSDDGLGEFLWLLASMKNGSLANNSEMNIPTNTGTHVDAPGQVYDHYFDAGFDVDTLNLHVLIELIPPRRELYGSGKIYDITQRISPATPSGEFPEGIGESYLTLLRSMKNGSDYNFSIIKLPAHSGTHVDAPGHFYENYYEAAFDIDSLDLEVLNGPALLVDVPRDKNITAEVMKSLNIPKGVRRVLFRTLNTDRRLMSQPRFDTSYVGFMEDGAQWLKDNTDIKLVAAFDNLKSAHLVFLKSREIILVERLKLQDVKAGLYDVHCLPLRLLGAEGSPIRCILIE